MSNKMAKLSSHDNDALTVWDFDLSDGVRSVIGAFQTNDLMSLFCLPERLFVLR